MPQYFINLNPVLRTFIKPLCVFFSLCISTDCTLCRPKTHLVSWNLWMLFLFETKHSLFAETLFFIIFLLWFAFWLTVKPCFNALVKVHILSYVGTRVDQIRDMCNLDLKLTCSLLWISELPCCRRIPLKVKWSIRLHLLKRKIQKQK